jgi:hypothetical protein
LGGGAGHAGWETGQTAIVGSKIIVTLKLFASTITKAEVTV